MRARKSSAAVAVAKAPARAPVTLDDIEAARGRLTGAIVDTDCDWSRTLSDILGCKVWLKFENQQFTASFKERGALNRLSALSPKEKKQGVIAMSAGNHAQGVAYHAHRLAIPATIVMPTNTPTVKVVNTRRHGAEVMLTGETVEEAAAFAQAHGRERGLTFIHPYDDPLVIAGQGTLALEMLGAAPEIDTFVVPIGGGGLISGIAVAAKALKPGIRVIGVQAELYPSMYNTINGKQLPMRGDTLAEGIAVKAPGRITQAIVRELVDDIVLVTEQEIERAVSLLINIEKTVVEGAGAAGLAAVVKAARAVQGPHRRPRAVRGQHRHAAARQRADARARPRGASHPAHHRSGGSAGAARQGRDPAGRGRRQHRRGLSPAHLLRPAGQGRAARARHRDARPRAPERDGDQASRTRVSR